MTVLRFKATRPGTFVYHCAPGGPMIPWHVVSGMSGAIMILPRDGLKDHKNEPVKYDTAYYIGENDFYIPKDSDGEYMRFEDTLFGKLENLTILPSRIWKPGLFAEVRLELPCIHSANRVLLMYKKILIPIDMASAEKADEMIAVAKQLSNESTKLILLNVVYSIPAYTPVDLTSDYFEIAQTEAKASLSKIAGKSEVAVDIEIQVGDAHHVILEMAKEKKR
ncbi:Copper-containing nitrite reductase [Nymphon striatum]|nr:Copper-containing nitrite reductase [Nymphon striatum]